MNKIATGVSRFVGLTLGCGVLLSGVVGCSSGGGDDDSDFVGAAVATIRTSPNTIDTGDRTRVLATLREVNEEGVALKFRFPSELFYVTGSAKLIVDDKEIDASPTVNTSDDRESYLVFYFSQSQFDEDMRGAVMFDLEAADEVSDEEIEVDADVDDPLVDNAVEFSIDRPEFGAEDSASIEVID